MQRHHEDALRDPFDPTSDPADSADDGTSGQDVPGVPPFRLDLEDLRVLASEAIVRRGIAYFREDRVTGLGWDSDHLWAFVEGSSSVPYRVEVSRDEEGAIWTECTCPFDWEPVCKHAVAVLVMAAHLGDEAERAGAEGDALEERRQSARDQVTVRHLDGDRWFGTWEARSTGLYGSHATPRRVQIRSLADRVNHCDCPDFATNMLGTCKHVEAVLHHLRKRAPVRFERMASRGAPVAVVALDWTMEGGPGVVVASRHVAGDAALPILDRWFGPDGRFRGGRPEDLFEMERSLRGAPGVQVADEILEHARRLVEDEAHAARAARIRSEIRAGGGRLPGVNAKLYSYQVEGVAFLASSGRAVLADDMGLGKTLQAIAASRWLVEHEGVRKVLIVCPASLKSQWEREIGRFTGATVQVIQGGVAQRLRQWGGDATFFIANYELLLRDLPVVQQALAPDLLVLDEAQRIRNWRTRIAATVKALRTRYAFVLTGTPLENRLEDLYSLMQVVDPRVLGPLWGYLQQFHVRDELGKVTGYRNLAELRRRLLPAMLRRDRALVRDQLPERIEQRIDVQLTQRQRSIHDEAESKAARLAMIARKRPLTPSEHHRLMAALQEARMACDAAGLVDKETTGSPKLEELGRLLEELCVDGRRKVVIFSEWERMTAMAEDVARGLGLGTVRLHGGVPSAQRGALIDSFRDDPHVQVFLSTDAGGVGLNLQAASVLINLDLPWNPAVLEQRIARVHRLGQAETVHALLLVAADSYETHVLGRLGGKRKLFDAAVVGGEGAADQVDLEAGTLKMVFAALLEAEGSEGAPRGTGEQHEAGPDAVSTEPEGEAAASQEAVAAQEAAVAATAESGEVLSPAAEPPPAAEQADAPVAVSEMAAAPVAVTEETAAAPVPVPVPEATAAAPAPAAEPPGRPDAAAGPRFRLAAEGPPSALPAAAQAVSVEERRARGERLHRRVDAAQYLADGGFATEAVGLAAAAMVEALAAALGRPAPPVAAAAVWLYGELLPQGVIDAEAAVALGRSLALQGSTVPADLCRQVLSDARRAVRGAEAGAEG